MREGRNGGVHCEMFNFARKQCDKSLQTAFLRLLQFLYIIG